MKQTASFTQKFMSTPYFQNVVVYEPRTPEDVQLLIDYLKQHEPAVVNLDNVEPIAAQRILDFVSGATYALSGSVHRIAGNIFLLSPEGVGITVPYEAR
jgi:cell division inhibitor SepF